MKQTLFERLGGNEGIAGIVDAFVEAHANNPAINARFIPVLQDKEKVAVIRKNTIDFFGAHSGGANRYAGRDMETTHRGMNISHGEYLHAVDDVLYALDKHQIDEGSKAEVLYILWSIKDKIIAR
ncbi:MAG: group 1 truncated hemoglobin [Bacteroidetes bacterium]|jgi:hemoglobin|nr:group 1 truncated hemoglobin [Bacteroidota bacterium]